MAGNDLRELKLTFERKFNFGGGDIREYLNDNPGLPDFLIGKYKKMLEEDYDSHLDYYVSIQNKLMYLEDVVQNG